MKTKIYNTVNKILLGLMLAIATHAAWAVETVTYYHNDALGSPVAATDATGQILWKEDYHPYGSRIRKQSSDSNQQWFTGKHHENDIDLTYFGARWYDPNIGRFMAIDPVGFNEGNIQSHNRYAYANNNPYLFVDPDGRESVDSVEERLRTGNTLRHPAGGSSSSYPDTMNLVPGFSPPMSSAELGITAASAATGLGAIRQGIKWGLGRFAAKSGADNIANASKLANQLKLQSARSPFKQNGNLTADAIKNSREIIPSSEIKNSAIPKGFSKYSTETFQSPSGNFQTHFYKNSKTGKVFYGQDYKTKFN